VDELSVGNESEGNGVDEAPEGNESEGNGVDEASAGNKSEGNGVYEAPEENALEVVSDGNKRGPSRPLFTNAVWDFRLKYSMTNDDIIYYLLSTAVEGNNPRELMESTPQSKTRSLNLFAIEVSRTSVSKYYYLCQFCDGMCGKIISIEIDRHTAIVQNVKSQVVHSNMLMKRSWFRGKEYNSIIDEAIQEHKKLILEFGKINLLNPFRVRPEQVLPYMRYFVAEFLMDRINHTLTSSGYGCKVSEIYYRETGQDPEWQHP
jgi:hypothetical protein